MDKRQIIVDYLTKLFPNAKCELNGETPFEFLVSVILSAQCTDARVNMTTPSLFAKYSTPQDFVNANLTDVENIIKPCGFYHNKAVAIKKASKDIIERFNGEVPSDFDVLCSLSGVGRKTDNVMIAEAFGGDAFAVEFLSIFQGEFHLFAEGSAGVFVVIVFVGDDRSVFENDIHFLSDFVDDDFSGRSGHILFDSFGILAQVVDLYAFDLAGFRVFLIDVHAEIVKFDRDSRFKECKRMIHRNTFHHDLSLAEITRSDLQLEVKAKTGQRKCKHDDRRHNLKNGDAASAHCRDLVVCGESAENQHDGDQRSPRNRKGECDRQHIQHEQHGRGNVDAVGDVFKDLYKAGARHAERQDSHRHKEREKEVLGNIKI